MMFENQYFISEKEVDFGFENFKTYSFDSLVVKAHEWLSVTTVSSDRMNLCLIGYVFDPNDPDRSDIDICNELSTTECTIEGCLRSIDRYSGRFSLLIRMDGELYAIPDACALRRIYYSFLFDGMALSSSPKLIFDAFDQDPEILPAKRRLIGSRRFIREESPWYGDGWYDDRVRKILPNHYLNLTQKTVHRIPFFRSREYRSELAILEDVYSVIQGSLIAASKRYRLVQALTAGLESRVLLACSRPVSSQIKYFVFQNGISEKHPDVVVPNRLAYKVGVDFEVFLPERLNDEFLEQYKNEHLFPRILPKTCNIQYHFDHHKNMNIMNINGNGGGIIKCNYGHRFDVSLASIRSLTTIPSSSYIDEQISKWYREVEFLKKGPTVTILDAFYWEQRMGQWGGHFPAEQDIAIEEFTPLNNRRMLLAILEVDSSRRRSPRFSFFQDLVRLAWPEVLTEPINPSWQLKDIVGKATRRVYLSYVLQKK